MKLLKRIFVGLLVLVVLLVVGSFFLPSTYRVERSVVINAKPKEVWPWVGRLKKWPGWTVWNQKLDPEMKITFEGPEDGVGSIYKWQGPKVGDGMMVVTQSEKDRSLGYNLVFDGGKFVSTGGLSLTPEGENTRLVWHSAGELGMNPVNRYFGLLMDRMIGPDFEKGLDNLSLLVESEK